MGVVIVYYYTLKRISKIEVSIIENSINNNSEEIIILFLDYSSENFKEIDNILSTSIVPKSIKILFSGPEWLINLKRKRWNVDLFSDEACINLMRSLQRKDGVIEYNKKKRKCIHITETVQYLKLAV